MWLAWGEAQVKREQHMQTAIHSEAWGGGAAIGVT